MPRDCPKCDRPLTRIQRKPWMHRLPGSKYYKCRQCGSGYLLIFDRWLLKLKQTPPKAAGFQGS
jgi:hypothetical protein